MKRGWQVATIALFLLCGWFAFESLQLSLTDALGPGPGFFPFWLSVAGGGLALVLFAQVTSGRETAGAGALAFDRAGLRSVVLVFAGLAAGAALLDLAGYRLVLAALIAYLLVVLGVRNWLVIAIFACAGSFGVFHVFYRWLKVPLPAGIFGF